MQEISFKDLPQECKALIDQIEDETIRRLYSNFTFLYLPLINNDQIKSEQYKSDFENFIVNYIKKSNFFTINYFRTPNSKTDNSHIKYTLNICIESKFLIIESIEYEMIQHIITKQKEQFNNIFIDISSKTDFLIKQEIDNFCLEFEKEIQKNQLVKNTISPIICYMIRRYFYPTKYFEDKSFFTFDSKTIQKTDKIQTKLNKILFQSGTKLNPYKLKTVINEIKTNNSNNSEISNIEFNMKDFIILREIFVKRTSKFILVLHRKSFYIFLMKQIFNQDDYKYEINFCSHYSHQCLTHFYGFLKERSKIIGFIYEFQCNGSLDSFLKSHPERYNEQYTLMTIIRLFQGIKYLHENSLIHRDIKPSNILIDHDFIPYLSDYDTIRYPLNEVEINNNVKMTDNIGSFYYTSPEQDQYSTVSFPTDIYSFGLVIYFLKEKEHMFLQNDIMYCSKDDDKNILKMKHGSQNLQNLYEDCVKSSPSSRPKINEIEKKIIYEVESLKKIQYDENIDENDSIVKIINETILILPENELNQFTENIFTFQFNYLYNKFKQDSKLIYKIGNIYFNGLFIKQDYHKAKEYYEQSVELNNSNALNQLGKMYEKGFGVEQDYTKAKELYEKSTQFNNPKGIFNLAYLYEKGFGVPKNYSKAKELYEKSASLYYADAFDVLGYMYDNGLGVEQSYSKAIELYEIALKYKSVDAALNLGYLYENGLGVKQDFSKAFSYYKIAARKNDEYALNNLGKFYLDGIYVQKDYKKAFEYFLKVKELNCCLSFTNLGFMYEKGFFVEQDYSKAREYYEKAAEYNDSDALYNLGILYQNSLGVEQDYSKAREYYEKAAEQNNILVLNNLGILYQNGLGVEQDYSKAREYYEKAAEQNNLLVLNNLGTLYQNGLGVEQNYSKAKEYYEKAAEQNDSNALCNLGLLYLNGLGVEQDYSKAIEYYEKAAEQNNSDAIYYLGTLYQNGKGVEQDYSKTKEYYEKAAELKNIGAINSLGALYQNGQGVEQDYSKAREYYEKAAEQNDSNALVNLGSLYQSGLGIEQDYLKASELYEKAAKQNNILVLNNLGILYQNGLGVEQDYSKAREYYEKAAEQNNSVVLNNIGTLYQRGQGVEQNYSKAKEYYEKAAEQNDSYALCNLGFLYLNGLGVEQDYPKAIEYYEKAAEQKNCESEYNLGCIHFSGIGVKIDYVKARKYFELSYKSNKFSACIYLGVIYLYGLDVKKKFNIARKYFEIAAEHNISDAFINLGSIYFNGFGVVRDFLRAKYYYEKAIKLGNSYGYLSMGVLFLYGLGVEKNISRAIVYFNEAAKMENSSAIIELGVLYEKGFGVEKNYSKAIEYYQKAANLKNISAYSHLGDIYKNGCGVEQNYLKAINFYEIGAKNNDSYSLFNLGYLYSLGETIEVDIQKSIEYLTKCSLIKEEVRNTISFNIVFNYFSYRASNDLGLIYLQYFQNIEKANENFKKSAIGEYPFGQNNYGLICLLYNNFISDADYMFEKASKQKFALSEYNLGYMKEKENKIEESIAYYIKASEHEDEPLLFHLVEHNDKRLYISKMFILCFTNLKLSEYFFTKSQFSESKKYFIKSFLKLIVTEKNYIFNLHFNEFERSKNRFSYLKSFILNFPLFNLNNQPFLNLHIEPIEIPTNESNENNDRINDFGKKFENLIQLDKKIEKKGNQLNNDPFKSKYERNNEIIFNDPLKLFDFVLSNNELKNEFIEEIKEIIGMMKIILYTRPYLILFGRISLTKNKTKIINENNQIPNINESFYDGFGIE